MPYRKHLAYTIDKICAKKKRFKLYWLRAGKNLTSPTKFTSNQPLTSQASNKL